jgi:small subunit ribosomal protein S16
MSYYQGLSLLTAPATTPRPVWRSSSLSVKIRLARHGAKKRPYYRIVVADSRMPRDGRFIEQVGRYNPLTEPKTVEIDLEEVDAWIAKGAKPTSAVENLIEIARGEKAAPDKKAKPSKKTIAKAKAAAEEAAAAAEAEAEPAAEE